GLAARRAVEPDQPADDVALRLRITLLKDGGALHRRRLHRGRSRGGFAPQRRRGRDGHGAARRRLGRRGRGPGPLGAAKARRTDDRDFRRLLLVGRTVRTEVPRFVDEVPVVTPLISHVPPHAWNATATALPPPK